MINRLISNILLGLCTTFLLVSCQKEQQKSNQFTVEGEIIGLDSHLFFRHPDRAYSREYPSDTIFVKDGKFRLTDSISDLNMIRAYTSFNDENTLYKRPAGGRGYYPVKSMYVMFFAFPGADVKVTGEATDFMNAYPSGDEYNNSLTEINKKAFPNFNESVNLTVQSTFETDSLKIQELTEKSEEVSEVGRLDRIKYIDEHPTSLGALWYLDDMIMRRQIEDDKAIALFKKVSTDLSEIAIYKNVQTRVSGMESTKEGMPVPAIKTTATPDGSEFDIASLRGKYILIDFWGVWCGPCVAEMPTVKAFQEKYNDKLVVLGINSGDTKEKMQNFLKENGYTWQQVMSTKSNTSDNFVSRFNVQGFPTKFIIDPEGKIVKRYLGSGEEAFELLEELLN